MPVHNGAAYLREAIESILAQTWRDFEFIIVDDGSTDATPAIIAQYAERDGRIRLHRQEKQGVAAALNAGTAQARARLLARMDADDKAHPERLVCQFDFLQMRPDVVAVGSAVETIDEIGRSKGAISYAGEMDSIEHAIKLGTIICHPTAMIRIDPLRQAGGYRARFEGAEDCDLWLRLLSYGRLVNLPAPLLHHRLHAGQVSKRFRARSSVALFMGRYAAAYRLRHGFDPAIESASFAIDAVYDCLKDPPAWAPIGALRKTARQIGEADRASAREVRRLLWRIGAKARSSGETLIALRALADAATLALRSRALSAPQSTC